MRLKGRAHIEQGTLAKNIEAILKLEEDQSIAMTASEQASGAVQLGDPATAIHSVCSDRTHKPGPLSTEPARRPFDGYSLHIAPILAP